MQQMNKMQIVKRRFFAMRNGLLADSLRRGPAAPFRIIFGLNLPQLAEIARETGYDPELAAALWANTTTRESMLLAPMLLDPAEVLPETALRMAVQSPTPEVADVLCHRLLKHMPVAHAIIRKLAGDDDAMRRYTALRLMMNTLTPECVADAMALADAELTRECALTRSVAMQLSMECDWLCEESREADKSEALG